MLFSTDHPLHLAALRGNINELNQLLGDGGDPNATDGFGQTLLHAAAASGSVAIVDAVVAAGGDASLDVLDANGRTPLSVAAMLRSTRIQKHLRDEHAALWPSEIGPRRAARNLGLRA